MVPRDQANDDPSQPQRQFRCPVCKRVVKLPKQGNPGQARFFPLCSERCKLIDLGAWLDAEYRIPGGPDEDPEGPPNEGLSTSKELL